MKLSTMKARGGFTLIELLVVIAIIGVLSTLAVVSLNNARAKSRDAKRVSDVKQVQTGLELFYVDNEEYPAGSSLTLGGSSAKILSTAGFSASGAESGTTYMGQVPSDPLSAQNYVYTQTSSGASYTIGFTLEGPSGSLAAGARTATPSGVQ